MLEYLKHATVAKCKPMKDNFAMSKLNEKYFLPVFFLFLLITPLNALSQTRLEGLFNCNIENVAIKQMQDGRSMSWSRAEGGISFNKGDIGFIKYLYTEKIEEGKTKGRIIVAGGSQEPQATGDFMMSGLPMFFVGSSSAFFENGRPAGHSQAKVYWSDDFLSFTSGSNTLNLIRYFKNDWHGYATDVIKLDNDLDIQLIIHDLSCRHRTDTLGEISRRIASAVSD